LLFLEDHAEPVLSNRKVFYFTHTVGMEKAEFFMRSFAYLEHSVREAAQAFKVELVAKAKNIGALSDQ
jgi:hypothetical protein